jgi:pimeloyl-ACP methyl ester carboxylesterase
VLAKIHYAIYGQGSPVVFLHGGLMPLASASPPRSVAIGAGVGGKVSHRSAAKGGNATQAMNAARANWRVSFSVRKLYKDCILLCPPPGINLGAPCE